MTSAGAGEEREGNDSTGPDVEPWPPARGRAEVLDLILDLTEALRRDDDGALAALLDPGVVVSTPPHEPSGAFRRYFGVTGAVEAARQWRTAPSKPSANFGSFRVAGRHAVVVAALRWPGHPERSVAWLCSARDGRLYALRCFRYPSDAFVRLSLLGEGA